MLLGDYYGDNIVDNHILFIQHMQAREIKTCKVINEILSKRAGNLVFYIQQTELLEKNLKLQMHPQKKLSSDKKKITKKQ